MSVRCVLFDLFGTLVHYDPGRVTQAYPETYQVLAELGCELSSAAALDVIDRTFVEMDAWSKQQQREYSMLDFSEKLFATLLSGTGHSQTDYFKFIDAYIREWSRPVSPVHGVQALLSRASKQFTLGLITNTHYASMVSRIVQEHQLHGFQVITTSVQHGRPKPHPDIFLDTLQQLDCSPQQAVYVGDNYAADYLGATGVGMQCYLLGKHARVPRDYQIPTVIDLPLHLIR
jgi:HAD superfamily hydrolase (TIGR01549 family)